MMHPEHIYVVLDRTVSVRNRGIPGLHSLLVAVGRPGETLPTSTFGLDSPNFLDTGDTALCLPVPRLRRCLRVMDFASDIDRGIPNVIGLRAVQPDAAVVKVMSIPNNRCVQVVVLDDSVGTDGLHEILIHDMADADAPDVPVSDLGCLRLDWPKEIFSYMGRYQVDLEHLHHECRERFSNVQSGLCSHCGK